MPQTLDVPPSPYPRIRWKVEQYENMFTMGLIPSEAYELIEGDVVEKMPVKRPHTRTIKLLWAILTRLFGFDFLLSQFSLRIGEDSLPEPDFAVLLIPEQDLPDAPYYFTADMRLLVEVSDATLSSDLTTKARLYARAGVPEYWVVDVNGRRVLVHQMPSETGYSVVTEYTENETLAPAGANGSFTISEILP